LLSAFMLLMLAAQLVLSVGCSEGSASEAAAPLDAVDVRTIEHALGVTRVPQPVQRIVALEWTYVEGLLALGVQPVGIADLGGYAAWVTIGPQLSPDVVSVGTRQEPSIESIAHLQPDLII